MKYTKKFFHAIYLFWGFITFFFWMLLMLPFVWLSYVLFKGKQATDIAFKFLNIWGFGFNIMMGYYYRIKNQKVVNRDKPYIFIANHSSYLDAIVIVRVIPQSVKPLGKIEMTRVPIFGFLYKRLVVLIDRSSKESREQSVIKLKDEIGRGQSILIFPEGTMNKTSSLLTDFYDGAFKIAIETQTPILPLIIANTKDLMPRVDPLAIKPGKITCSFLAEIAVEGKSLDDLTALKAAVFQQMETELACLRGKFNQ